MVLVVELHFQAHIRVTRVIGILDIYDIFENFAKVAGHQKISSQRIFIFIEDSENLERHLSNAPL